MRKPIVGALMACAIAVSCTVGGLAAFAEGHGSLWRAGRGTSVADSDELGGSAYVTGFMDGGNWAYYGEKVKLDGLTVSMKIGETLAATAGLGGIGFGLGHRRMTQAARSPMRTPLMLSFGKSHMKIRRALPWEAIISIRQIRSHMQTWR